MLALLRHLLSCVAGLALALVLLAATGAATARAPAPAPRLGIHRLGPLHLGMTRADALRTGWLAHPTRGCELASPVPTDYSLTGRKAPRGIAGGAEFSGGRLTTLELTRGSSSLGAVIGKTSANEMVRIYRRAGFAAKARYDRIFGVTFVTVSRHGHVVFGGQARSGKLIELGAPSPVTCD